MAGRSSQSRVLLGTAELLSPAFSNEWTLIQDGVELAAIRRHPRVFVSTVRLDDGTRWVLEPAGRGVVRAVEDESEIARAVRRSWIGRRWDLVGTGFAYELASLPMPRSWIIAVGGSQVASISGRLLSYNRVTFEGLLSVPLVAVLLAWQVVARPWEAAAEPGRLVPGRAVTT